MNLEVVNNPELVYVKNERPVTYSLIVAKYFEKSHSDLLKHIRKKLRNYPILWTEGKFSLSEYQDNTGKSNNMYILSRDAFAILALGLSGRNAAKFQMAFLDEFNRHGEIIAKLNSRLPSRKYQHKFGYFQVDSTPDGLGKMSWVSGAKTLAEMDEIEKHAWVQRKLISGALGQFKKFLTNIPENDRYQNEYSDIIDVLSDLKTKFKPKHFGSRYLNVPLFDDISIGSQDENVYLSTINIENEKNINPIEKVG